MTKINIGDKVPSVTFKTRKDGDWLDVSTNDIFSGKTVVVFALPGAFTPTCSSTHLPGYMDSKSELEAAGVDSIYCLSVNDTFVMNAWAKDQGIEGQIGMLPDGNAEFTKSIGMDADFSAIGFGTRAWRHSMLVKDGVVEKIFEEDRNESGDPFAVSDAKTMLSYLTEEVKQSA